MSYHTFYSSFSWYTRRMKICPLLPLPSSTWTQVSSVQCKYNSKYKEILCLKGYCNQLVILHLILYITCFHINSPSHSFNLAAWTFFPNLRIILAFIFNIVRGALQEASVSLGKLANIHGALMDGYSTKLKDKENKRWGVSNVAQFIRTSKIAPLFVFLTTFCQKSGTWASSQNVFNSFKNEFWVWDGKWLWS